MPYVDPNSIHVPGANSPPSSWGGNVRSNITFLAGDAASGNAKPMCRVYSLGGRNVPTATPTAILFDGERYEVGGALHSTVSNQSRITIPAGCGGIYHVGACIAWANTSSAGIRQMWIRLNGTAALVVNTQLGTAGDTQMAVSCDYKLADGDYIETVALQSSGSLLAVSAVPPYSPEMWCHWVGVG